MVITTIDALKTSPGTQVNECCTVLGYHTIGDGGGGDFYWKLSIETGDNGTVIPVPGKGTWTRIFSGPVNVKWFGAKGDGIADDSGAFNAVLAYLQTTNSASAFVPKGIYMVNIDIGGMKVNFLGEGQTVSKLKSYSNTGYAVTVGPNTSWENSVFYNIGFAGDSGLTRGGVQFGDLYAGRVIFDQVSFYDLNIAVLKQHGNIGNKFENCVFYNCNFHYNTHAQQTPVMHGGCDIFSKCFFQNAQKASIYVNSPVIASGQLIFNQCIFDGNPGFAFFIDSFFGEWSPQIVMHDVWFEGNATNTTTTINGSTYNTKTLRFAHAGVVNINNSTLFQIELINTRMLCEGCLTYTGFELTKDANSSIEFSNIQLFKGNLLNATVNSIAQTTSVLSPDACVFNAYPRVNKQKDTSPLMAITFEQPVNYGGTSSGQTSLVADGTIFSVCGEVTLSTNQALGFAGNFRPTEGKYLLITVDVKLQSGQEAYVWMAYNYYATGKTKITNNKWVTFSTLSICPPSGLDLVGLRVDGPATGNAVLRMSAFQAVQFDTQAEALAYFNSRKYALPIDYPKSVLGSGIPASGQWYRGDRIINSIPSAGQPKGWICSASGIPGTWISEGNL